MAIAVGLDCGGTTTRAMALDEAGAVVYTGQAGPANWASTPRDVLREHLSLALQSCPPMAAVTGCFAGLLTERDAAEARALLTEVSGCPTAAAYPDTRAVLTAAGPETTVGVIAGTGSSVFSMADGLFVRSGGGGPLLGDAGSAFAIGKWYLQQGLDEGEFPSQQLAVFEELTGARKVPEVVAEIYRRESPAKLVAAIGAQLLALESGDSAIAILREIFRPLARTVLTHLRRFYPQQEQWTIAVAGGVWEISANAMEAFHVELSETMEKICDERAESVKELRVNAISNPPVWGAARLAQQLLS